MTLPEQLRSGLSSRSHRRATLAFTLIELLMVIAIIGVLVGLVIGAASYARMKALVSRTKAEMEHIANALQKYNFNNGVYPDTLLVVTNDLPEGANLIDSWDSPYSYQKGPEGLSYTLYSLGPLTDPLEAADDIFQAR